MSSKLLHNRRVRLAAIAVVMLAVTAMFAIGRPQPAATIAPAPVLIEPAAVLVLAPTRIEVGPWISGTLRAEREATITAELSGNIVATYVEEGMRVAAGALLGRIDDPTAEVAVIAARTALRTAQENEATASRNEERARALLEVGGLPKREAEAAHTTYLAAQAGVADANATLAVSQRRLDKTILRAPFAGVVSMRGAKVGDVVQPGTPLFGIVDPSSMRLEAAVPAARLAELRVGADVHFTVVGYGGKRFLGHIQRVNPVADPATRQVSIYVHIPNAAGGLEAGLFAEGRVAAEVRNGIVVPTTGVEFEGATPVVVRFAGGIIERRQVRLGVRDEQTDRVEVLSGLAPGDTVVIGGARALRTGTHVRIGTNAP